MSPMMHRAAATADTREAIRGFLAAAADQGFILVERGALIPTPITPADELALIDRHFAIDRAQLQAERAAQLTPGAECACGD